MDLHHQPDQSYRIPRRLRAERTRQRTQSLIEEGAILPAALLSIPEALLDGPAALRVSITTNTSQGAAMMGQGKMGVLIFGSANRPGGGWLNGAKAQEEDVSLASTWGTQAALAPPGFYAHEPGLGGLGPDKLLIAEGLWLVDENGSDLPVPRDVVFGGIAAPNRANPQTARMPSRILVDHLARRLAGVLLAWEDRGVERAVMGAIGCGVFQWPVEESADALTKAIAHYKRVCNGDMAIVLALPDERHAPIFQKALANTGRRGPQP